MKKSKVYFYVKSIVSIVLVFLIISCKNKNDDKITSLKSIVKEVLGKKLIIPDSMYMYKPFTDYTADSIKISNSKLKIYSHIDASCGTCLESFKAWGELLPELDKRNVQLNLICSSGDKFELLKYFFESKEINNFHHYLFLDHNNQYIKRNKFMLESENFETVLTNKNNEILLMGSPVISKEMEGIYFREIEKHLK